MNTTRWLFVCSCIALVTSAFTFSLHGDIMQDMGRTFNFTQEQNGAIGQAIFYGMALSMLGGGFICDFLGMKRIMWLAFASHVVGAFGMVLSKQIVGVESSDTAYWWLYVSGLLMGCGNGFTEVGINPLVATLYPNSKTHHLNILHAWWPGGLIIGGMLAIVVRNFLTQGAAASPTLPGTIELWQVTLLLIVVPALIYGAMLLSSEFPVTERVESGVSTGDMFKETLRPMFLLWAFCMLLTAATELGPQKWQNSVMTSTANVSGTLILVYTSGMMFVLRHFAGPIAHKLSPVGMLTCSAVLSAIGLYLLSFADNALTAFGFATIYGLGIAYFWPTMLGVAAERFPKGGALILALMGTAGNISIAFVLPQMGRIVDTYAVRHVQQADGGRFQDILQTNEQGEPIALDAKKIDVLAEQAEQTAAPPEAYQVAKAAERVGFSMAFRWVSVLPAVLIVIFGAIALWDKSRGGYKPELLVGRDEEDQMFAGGVEAPVE